MIPTADTANSGGPMKKRIDGDDTNKPLIVYGYHAAHVLVPGLHECPHCHSMRAFFVQRCGEPSTCYVCAGKEGG